MAIFLQVRNRIEKASSGLLEAASERVDRGEWAEIFFFRGPYRKKKNVLRDSIRVSLSRERSPGGPSW